MGCTFGFPYRLAVSEVLPVAQPLLNGLFSAFHHPDSSENEYLMRAVNRLITFLKKEMLPVARMCLKVGGWCCRMP